MSLFPEGDIASNNDNEARSLRKITSLLASAASSGSGSGAAPAIADATLVTFGSGESNVINDAVFLGTLIGAPAFVRWATVYAPETNTGILQLSPVDAGSIRPIGPGQEYVIPVPPGTKFSLDSWIIATTILTGDTVSVQFVV